VPVTSCGLTITHYGELRHNSVTFGVYRNMSMFRMQRTGNNRTLYWKRKNTRILKYACFVRPKLSGTYCGGNSSHDSDCESHGGGWCERRS
jgi:hypothetical protein